MWWHHMWYHLNYLTSTVSSAAALVHDRLSGPSEPHEKNLSREVPLELVKVQLGACFGFSCSSPCFQRILVCRLLSPHRGLNNLLCTFQLVWSLEFSASLPLTNLLKNRRGGGQQSDEPSRFAGTCCSHVSWECPCSSFLFSMDRVGDDDSSSMSTSCSSMFNGRT